MGLTSSRYADEKTGVGMAQIQRGNAGQMLEIQRPTQRGLLMQKKEKLEQELAKVDAAIQALNNHPELEEFTETLNAALLY